MSCPTTYNFIIDWLHTCFPCERFGWWRRPRAKHIGLHSATCLRHCETMDSYMVYNCGPNFIRDSLVSSCSSASSPYSTTTLPYYYSSSSSSSRQLPLLIYLAKCLHVQKLYWCCMVKLFKYMLAAFTVMDSTCWGTKHTVWLVIWVVWNSSFVNN